jgi:hypothetical protein
MNLLILFVAVTYFILFNFFGDLFFSSPCVFASKLRFYCPGCGGSRSLAALMKFHFIESFLLYPPIIISALVILDYDRRLILSIVKKDESITDKFKYYTFIFISASVILNFIIRNILLLGFKIDTLGNFF